MPSPSELKLSLSLRLSSLEHVIPELRGAEGEVTAAAEEATDLSNDLSWSSFLLMTRLGPEGFRESGTTLTGPVVLAGVKDRSSSVAVKNSSLSSRLSLKAWNPDDLCLLIIRL